MTLRHEFTDVDRVTISERQLADCSTATEVAVYHSGDVWLTEYVDGDADLQRRFENTIRTRDNLEAELDRQVERAETAEQERDAYRDRLDALTGDAAVERAASAMHRAAPGFAISWYEHEFRVGLEAAVQGGEA